MGTVIADLYMKIRGVREFFTESMKEVEEISTKEELLDFVKRKRETPSTKVRLEDISFSTDHTFDPRNNWDTYYILYKGSCVGFSDGSFDLN